MLASRLAQAFGQIGTDTSVYPPEISQADRLASCNLCGNGTVDLGEACDGDDLNGVECVYGGAPSCASDCKDIDYDGCNLCGDGTVQTSDGEECEDNDLGGLVCSDFGYAGGNLHCTFDCQYDLSGCGSGPPAGCTPGEPGCGCLQVDDDDLEFEAGHPDGAAFPDKYCRDDVFDVVCVDAPFFPDGKCVECGSTDRAAGCGCEDNGGAGTNPCDTGLSCQGTDTGYAGTPVAGRCWDFDNGPPSWQCLANCEELLNDSEATCYHRHPSGEARCIDSGCSVPASYNCWVTGNEPPVCFDGGCSSECATTADCSALGYPSAHECDLLVAGGACRRLLP